MRNKYLGKPPKTMMNSQCDVIHNTQEQKKKRLNTSGTSRPQKVGSKRV